MKVEKKIKEVNLEIENIVQKRKHILELYANQEIPRGVYVEKEAELDKLVNELKIRKEDLLNNNPYLIKKILWKKQLESFVLVRELDLETQMIMTRKDNLFWTT